MALNNNTILARAWLEGTNDYQQVMPAPEVATLTGSARALFDPMNGMIRNQFVNFLVNRIGYTYAHTQRWENPLAVFKQGKITFGSTIQEVAAQWVKAHSYDDEAFERVLKMYRPDGDVAYHSQNYQVMFPITINEKELRTAVVDEFGLNKFVAMFMTAPVNSDNYAEYRTMLQLIGLYEHEYGFYKHHLTGAVTDETTGKEFLKAVQTYVGKLAFPSTIYNADAVNIPVFAQPNELVLFVTPELNANLSVDVLASLFNVDFAEIKFRKIIVDEFPIPGAQALLTTEDFYMCQDTLYENASQYNAATLSTNYFLHHWAIMSVSPFVPAILFTTEAGSEVETITQTVTGVNITAGTWDAVKRVVPYTVELTGTVTPGDNAISVKPNAVTWDISAMSAAGDEAVALDDFRTYVDKFNVLHVEPDLEAGTKISLTGTATYINPSGVTTPYIKTVEFTIPEA